MFLLRAPRLGLREHRWYFLALLGMIVAFFAVSLWLSLARWLGMYPTNWDLGIFQQALWSTSHGRLLYEAGDYETYGAASFLQVHPAPILLLLVPLYAVASSAVTLFVVQSATVALAALPLAAFARDLSGSRRTGLVVAGLYLSQAALLGATAYDFHLEAFLPFEFFVLMLLWSRRRYVGVVLVSLVTMLTIEVGPVLVASAALFMLAPDVADLLRALWRRLWRVRAADPRPVWTFLLGPHGPSVRFALGMFVAAVLGYEALRAFEYAVVPQLIGLAPSGGTLESLGGAGLGMSLANLQVGISQKISYWVLLFAMGAFLPFRSPRSLFLMAPWTAYTFLVGNLAFTTLGYQYGFVAVALVLCGVAYGLRDLPLAGIGELVRALRPRGRRQPEPAGRFRVGPRAPAGSRWALALLLVVLLNVALSPADPLMQMNSSASGYRVSYAFGPGFAEVTSLASLISGNRTVLATPNLFPFVAHSLLAYSLIASAQFPGNVPFNLSAPPDFVLLCQSQVPLVPSWLAGLLYTTTYGVRGAVWQTPAGTVLLFEKGWRGPYEAWGPAPPVPEYFWGHGLVVGPAGTVVPGNGTPSPASVQSLPGQLGAIWYGPYQPLASGNYVVEVSLRAQFWDPSQSFGGTTPVLEIQIGAYGVGNWADQAYSLAALGGGAVCDLSFPIHVAEPVTGFEVRGYQLSTNVVVTMFYVLVTAA